MLLVVSVDPSEQLEQRVQFTTSFAVTDFFESYKQACGEYYLLMCWLLVKNTNSGGN